ncbi:MAG TPA: outer membrane lipoprotein carrier protein LolA [Candidatus Methylomirabilis sp.]|nr:outer membrane lipoprotein carrier protein LolA [Candidatus Methylomirabilis sp.]
MKLWAAALAAFLLSWHALGLAGAAPTESQIQGKERIEIIERLQQRQREVTGVRAAVVQRKRHPLLAGEAVSQGVLLFRRPNLVRWEMSRPDRTIILFDGRTVLTYHPDREEAERRDLRDDFGVRSAVDFLTSGMSLAISDLEKRFQVELYRKDGQLVLRLTPRSRLLARVIASVAIYQHEGEAIPRQIEVIGQKGDRTEITLTGVAINPRFPEDAFILHLGPGVRVTDVGKSAGEGGSDR